MTTDNNVNAEVARGPKQPAHFADRDIGVKRRLFFGFAVIGLLVLGGGGWAATAELSGAIIAPGSVVVDRHVKKLQHRDGGIVSMIHVRNGDLVKAGDPLVTLDDTQLRASLNVVRAQLVEYLGRKARLEAERDDRSEIVFPAELATYGAEGERVMLGERRLRDNLRETRLGQKEQLLLRIEQLNSEIGGMELQQRAKTKELGLISKELSQVRGLYERKLTSVSRVYAMEREESRISGEVGSLVAQVARAKGQISEIKVQIISIDQSAQTDTQRELREMDARIAELRQREVAALDQLGRVEMRAPIAGLVHELAVHTIGGVVTPAEPVLLIVPEDDELAIELRLQPSDIDQVAPGQPVRLRFSAFNQRTTPELYGRITKVSADVTRDPVSGQNFFIGRAALNPGEAAGLADQRILPGMPVEVFVTTESRTALSFLTKPFTDQISRTFREQ